MNRKRDIELFKKDFEEYVSKRCSKACFDNTDYKNLAITFENNIESLSDHLPDEYKQQEDKCIDIIMELIDKAAIIAYKQCLIDISILNNET